MRLKASYISSFDISHDIDRFSYAGFVCTRSVSFMQYIHQYAIIPKLEDI
jgi:hypothetical protein